MSPSNSQSAGGGGGHHGFPWFAGVQCDHHLRLQLLISDLKSLLMTADVEKCTATGLQILPRVKKAGWQVLTPVPCCGQEALLIKHYPPTVLCVHAHTYVSMYARV